MTKNKKLGRPKLPGGKAKGVMLSARFTQPEADMIETAIKKSGQKQSAWIRNSLLKSAGAG